MPRPQARKAVARNMDTRRGETDVRQARGYPSGMEEAAARRSRFLVSVLRTYGRKGPWGGGHQIPERSGSSVRICG